MAKSANSAKESAAAAACSSLRLSTSRKGVRLAGAWPTLDAAGASGREGRWWYFLRRRSVLNGYPWSC